MLLMGVQGAWGIIPVYLGEIAPPAFRATFAGLAYQLGQPPKVHRGRADDSRREYGVRWFCPD